MNRTVPLYPTEYRRMKETKGVRDSWCQGRQRHGGDKTVPTEALRPEYTRFRHGGGGGWVLSETLFLSRDAVGCNGTRCRFRPFSKQHENKSWKRVTVSPNASLSVLHKWLSFKTEKKIISCLNKHYFNSYS